MNTDKLLHDLHPDCIPVLTYLSLSFSRISLQKLSTYFTRYPIKRKNGDDFTKQIVKSCVIELAEVGLVNDKAISNLYVENEVNRFAVYFYMYQQSEEQLNLISTVMLETHDVYSLDIYYLISGWRMRVNDGIKIFLDQLALAAIRGEKNTYERLMERSEVAITKNHFFKEEKEKFIARLQRKDENGGYYFIHPNLRTGFLFDKFRNSLLNIEKISSVALNDALNLLINEKQQKGLSFAYDTLITLLLMRGDMTKLEYLVHNIEAHPFEQSSNALLALVKGDYARANEQLLANFNNPNSSSISSMHLFMCLPLAYREEFTALKSVLENKKITIKYPLSNQAHFLMEAWMLNYKGSYFRAKSIVKDLTIENPVEKIMYYLTLYWIGALDLLDTTQAENLYTMCKNYGYKWMQMEIGFLLYHSLPTSDDLRNSYLSEANQLAESMGISSLTELLPRLEEWERALVGMEKQLKITNDTTHNAPPQSPNRLLFLLAFDPAEAVPDIEVKMQSISKKGGYTSGRSVDVFQLKYKKQNFSLADIKLIDLLNKVEHQHPDEVWQLHSSMELFQKIAASDNVYFAKNPKVKVELREQEPIIQLYENSDKSIALRFKYVPLNAGLNLLKETPTTYNMVFFTNTQWTFYTAVGKKEMHFPENATERMYRLLDNLKQVFKVESLLSRDLQDLPQIQADTLPHVHLLPAGKSGSYLVDIFTKPFGDVPPYYKPGQGFEIITAEYQGKLTAAHRDLTLEKKQADAIAENIAWLQQHPSENHFWEIEEPEDFLEVLWGLNKLRAASQAVVEWPKGEKLKVLGDIGMSNMELRISQGKDYWFSLQGEVKINENLVFTLQDFLEMSEQHNGGFIEITDGQFIAITKDIQRKLEAAKSLLRKKKDDLQFHRLAGLALESIFEDDLKADQHWENQKEQIRAAQNLHPRVPANFRATLRNYQKEGFEWMMKLAAWGVGACLADDMGLGKTIQALAVANARMEEGPTLVIAPASVCRNWISECEKFAPDLHPHLFGNEDRQSQVNDLQNGDLLVVSYGLVPFEQELLTSREYGTIILDEAQAIKNHTTKRFKIINQLRGKFKIVTTGTPMENHLGELWSIFEFINPGLLGSLRQFTQKFGKPIKNKNEAVQESLKNLVKPFILRRKKSEVLKELPAKTEVTLHIEMSEQERAFYEALRRKAVEKIEDSTEENPLSVNMQVLAEITRLRRACCHPRLISPTTKVPSAKLNAFGELVDELIENNHKALIFSQFVGYLKIVEQWVKNRGLTYQYLDGSTPLKKRQERVQAFQDGEGDLFLISLKAGGVGLTLTEADYVIILDPWWNPAVEDQAADRAHRIGQTRPVTVYRLVLENTIEEKIVKLHGEKRDLAASLLDGTYSSAKITAQQLLNILRVER